MNFTGKTVYITGANRGIGLELVRQFLGATGKPSHVFAACRNPDGATDLGVLKEAHAGVLHVVRHPVTDYPLLDAIVAQVSKEVSGKGLNILINNAGLANFNDGSLDATTIEDMREHFETNALAPLMITKAFLPLLKQASAANSSQPAGSSRAAIFNVSTQMASMSDNTSGRLYNYRSSKAALNAITKSLSVDLKEDKIIAVLLHPGHVKTDMGGSRASVETEDCVKGLLQIISTANENNSGAFINFKGQELPW